LIEVAGSNIDLTFASERLGATVTLARGEGRELALGLIAASQRIFEEES